MTREVWSDASILVADDELVNRRLLERLLADAGYRRVVAVTDGREALEAVRTAPPDLILLDLFMPHVDGMEVMRQVRSQQSRNALLPILVLTADVSPETRRGALAAGATDFLTKPLDAIEVLLRVANLLETRRLHLELRRHSEELEALIAERTRQLIQAEKLAAMGSLLAGVSHELNNPLAVVMGHAALLRHALQGTPHADRTEKMTAAAARCARIVKNFLALARQHPPERAAVSLNRLVEEVVELLAYQARVSDVQITLDLGPEPATLWADGHQLQQVVVNLLTNALHAVRQQPGPREIRFRTRMDLGRAMAELVVSDSGPGVPVEVQSRIFEPFFTTKPEGEGTGLGLSLCRGIVEEHGGTIRLASPPGAGATFVIELPLGQQPHLAPAPAGTPVVSVPGARSVLVVEDEPDVAGVLQDILEGDGHRVDTAGNGAEALDRLARHRYDIIVCDGRMPVLDGPGFYREVERRYPELVRRMVVITGDILNPERRRFLESTGVPFLTKPFDPDDVRRVLARVLGAPG